MGFPETRMRRLRQTETLRALVRETRLSPDDFIAPLFVVPGKGVRKHIPSLAGQHHLSPDTAAEEAFDCQKNGIRAALLFGLPPAKDDVGAVSYDDNGVVQQAIRNIKKDVGGLAVIADLCFCEYTSHGHCGVIKNNDVDNDATLEHTAKQAVSLARAGADIIAPSGMMDGMVRTIRAALDADGFSHVSILSYAAKFASAYYGPFRDAVDSTPTFGDRRTYQMDPANTREALREVALDIEEGADMVMVKPALAYLDIISKVRERYDVPLAAYNVSGEYAMIKTAAEKGLIDGERVMLETLLSIKRAGADMIITYFAKEAAALLR
jgi:porphobilinogen synthase